MYQCKKNSSNHVYTGTAIIIDSKIHDCPQLFQANNDNKGNTGKLIAKNITGNIANYLIRNIAAPGLTVVIDGCNLDVKGNILSIRNNMGSAVILKNSIIDTDGKSNFISFDENTGIMENPYEVYIIGNKLKGLQMTYGTTVEREIYIKDNIFSFINTQATWKTNWKLMGGNYENGSLIN